MSSASSSKIEMAAKSRTDASPRPTQRNLKMMEMKGDDIGGGFPFDARKTLGREAAHFEADRPRIELDAMPSLVGEIDHLRRLGTVFLDDEVRRYFGLPLREPVD
jgi:hypothetical protein